jgi:alpha-tubulin suppressor-like RCC1 family protein
MEKRLNRFCWVLGLGILLLSTVAFPGLSFAASPKTAGGLYHTLVLKSDGTLWAWGHNGFGQMGDGTTTYRHSPVQVGTDTDWVDIAVGDYHNLAIKANGTLWAWGKNDRGQLGDNTRNDSFSPIQIGTATDWFAIAAGSVHSLAIRPVSLGNALYAWGGNGAGQLGNGTTSDRLAPEVTGADVDWTSVIAGGFHTLARKSTGSLWAWGRNDYGQLGDGSGVQQTSPVRVNTDTDWAVIAAGRFHTLATKSNGSLWAWGANSEGQLGDGTGIDRETPRLIEAGTGTAWLSVAGGCDYTLALRANGTLWTWGGNGAGQLGDGSTNGRTTPGQVGSSTDWSGIACGGSHGIASKTDQTLWTWGGNVFGQLGDGTAGYRPVPSPVEPGTEWIRASAGNGFSLAIRYDQTLWAWGKNDKGQLGDGTTTDRYSPVSVGMFGGWVSIAAGTTHSAGIKVGGSLWSWGNNQNGQLGDGTTENKTSPIQIGTSQWKAVSVGLRHTVAIRTDGTLWAWGANLMGQLGDDSFDDKHSPVQIGTDDDWAAVHAGKTFTLALKTNGAFYGWGNMTSYSPAQIERLADGVTLAAAFIEMPPLPTVAIAAYVIRSTGELGWWGIDPVTLPEYFPSVPYSDWVSISATHGHAMGTRLDHSLWGNGLNEYGQLGNGKAEIADLGFTFQQIGTDMDWRSVSAGGDHTLAIKADRTLWSMGSNEFGQLGLGLASYETTPIQVFSVGPLSLRDPLNHMECGSCSYFNPPVFEWSAGEVFRKLEVQFTTDPSAETRPLKFKPGTRTTELILRSSDWKKVLLLPGLEGGTIYWRVVGTPSGGPPLVSEYRSVEIERAWPVGNLAISTTSKTALPTLSWENNCNKKFKVWIGSDETFTRKVILKFNVSDPLANDGIFSRQLTSRQWTSIRRLVGDVTGFPLFSKIESWDGLNRHAGTETDTFTLTD